jgi:parallel beta-helix repeat protein
MKTTVLSLLTLLTFLLPRLTTAQDRASVLAADHPTLQAAIDALPEAGGIVHLPPGVLEITSPLLIAKGELTLHGSGSATTIHNLNEKGQPALILRSGKANPKHKERDEPLWRILLSDFRLIGNEKSGHGIHALDCNELHLRSLTVTEHGADGIHMERCFENARITDCMITYNKATGLNLNVNNHDTVVAGNHFEENQDGLRSADGFNLTMSGNNLDDHLGSAIIIEKMMGSVISGNMLEQSQGWGIILDRDTYSTTISSNIFTNNAAGGIDLRDAHGCTISANTLARTPQNAIVVRKDSSRLTIAANTFANGYVGNNTILGNKNDPPHSSGITLENTRGLNINGNTFSTVIPAALTLSGTVSHCIFANNLLIDTLPGTEGLVQSKINGNHQVPTQEKP